MLRIIDHTGEVGTCLRRLLDGLSKLDALDVSGSGQPWEGCLLRSLREVYRLRYFAQLEARPLHVSGNPFHTGSARQRDQSSHAVVVRSTANPSANYLPWLQGKVSTVERCLYAVCDLSDGRMTSAAVGASSREDATREHLYMAIYSARESLEDVADLIEAGILKIQQVVQTRDMKGADHGQR